MQGRPERKRKNNLALLALNIQRQTSESGQQMVAMMARKRWGVVMVKEEESRDISKNSGEGGQCFLYIHLGVAGRHS